MQHAAVFSQPRQFFSSLNLSRKGDIRLFENKKSLLKSLPLVLYLTISNPFLFSIKFYLLISNLHFFKFQIKSLPSFTKKK